ncbi:MAG: hypothetical protein ABEJ56_04440 [Candidatus Nanohaloarchaea archaeon]
MILWKCKECGQEYWSDRENMGQCSCSEKPVETEKTMSLIM